ncbi:MAG: hypothetical protein C0595_04500 [Marinilabiliales bacterium]|nr:MAG: hypothetical protein C0595_04500 [Marinilabiliales bacterium]
MPYFLKFLNVVLLAGIKFFFAPIYAFNIGLDFWSTYAALVIGGSLSFLLVYYATNLFLVYVKHFKPKIVSVTTNKTRLYYRNWKQKRIQKRLDRKKFTKRNKRMVKIRRDWGMWGLIVSSPVLLSIPIGAILLRKYYGHRKRTIPSMLVYLLVWGLVLNTAYWLIMKIF